ncbi:MAG: ABC transporter ATP-binding protein [Archangiaceae bacterium]|nr:ABC transporter ATP-binding protein [Archangiaceae bacterium]
MALITATQLVKTYAEGATAVRALAGVSLTLNEGDFVAVMGPSGCGKSTLLHLLGGLDRPDAGTVKLGSDELTTLDDEGLTLVRRRRIGFVFQSFNLVPVMSAIENVALPLTLDGVSASVAEGKAKVWLERLGLGDRVNHLPDQLSGGQQQRVAIARALVTEPVLLLADEPTGNLDSKSADDIARLLRSLSDEHRRTVLMVTHDPRIAASARRLVFLKDGVIVDDQNLSASLDTSSKVRSQLEALS